MFAAILLAQALTILVGGRPLYTNPGPIEQAGRVFVPMRSIFERMGASVVYQSGNINATRNRTTVALTIGSTRALINGQPTQLDVAPFIVGATTYVPLRFIAQSLGAGVNYDDGTRVVSITMANSQPYNPAPPPPPPPPVDLSSIQPGAGTTIVDRFAVVSANFSRNVNPSTVRVWIDGADRTYQSGISARGFSFKPPAPLAFGSHTVRVAGAIPNGKRFDRSWSFTVRQGSTQMHLTISQPAGTVVASTFTVAGNTVANGRVAVTVGVPPVSFGQASKNVTAGPLGNFSVTIAVPILPGQQSIMVRVIATDPVTGRTQEQTLQLRLR